MHPIEIRVISSKGRLLESPRETVLCNASKGAEDCKEREGESAVLKLYLPEDPLGDDD